jgi:MerR family transcriptional regulator, light-induced transcriptional regulator
MYSVVTEFPGDRPLLRIGELSRRLSVSDHVLRARENRYGLLQPVRSPGGFRLYSEADEWRIRRMQAYLADGLSAAEAARAALSGDASTQPGRPAGPPLASAGNGPCAALRQTLDAFDEPAAQAVLDRLLADLSGPTVLRDVVLPYLAELGERWPRGTASVAMEHFASNVIRSRLAGLARGRGSGHGPQALLACPPGELHDMALVVFGIVLHPQRVVDRLSRGEHPGRGVGAGRRCLASWPGRPGRYPCGDPRAARPGARLTGPRRSRRHGADRNCGRGQADRGRPGDRGRAGRVVAVKVLVVGASGFVGRRLCPALAETGHDVAAMTRNPAAYAGAGTPVQADVHRPGTLGANPRPPATAEPGPGADLSTRQGEADAAGPGPT